MNNPATWRDVGQASWRLGRRAGRILTLQVAKLNDRLAAAALARVESLNVRMAAGSRTAVSAGDHTVAKR